MIEQLIPREKSSARVSMTFRESTKQLLRQASEKLDCSMSHFADAVIRERAVDVLDVLEHESGE